MPKKETQTPATRTLLVTKQTGEKFKIQFPEEYKVTCGVFSASGGGDGKYGGGSEAKTKTLRIYKNKDQQVAMFTQIADFRDQSLHFEIKVVRKKGKSSWEVDHNQYLREESETREESWQTME